jgi:hypothetical protein
MILSFILAKRSIISALLCQLAFSSKKVVFSCQPGDSRSNYFARCCMNVIITLLSVLAWFKEHHTLPSVSSAAINDSRGATYLSVRVNLALVGAQSLLRKRVLLSQLSSMLIMR